VLDDVTGPSGATQPAGRDHGGHAASRPEATELARPPKPPKPPKAGRNLPAAIAVGLVLAGAVVGTLYTVPWLFVVVAVAAVLMSVWELRQAIAGAGAEPPLAPLLVGTVAVIVAAYVGGAAALGVAFGLTVLVLVLWRLTGPVEGSVVDVSSSVWIAGYLPLMAGFVMLMLAQSQGSDRIIVFILTTICSDIGGYAVGVLFGRHPMAPRISPKKSWEGFAGSMVACVVAASLSGHWLLGMQWWQGAVLGLAIVLTATLGDLAESMVKRDLGIKDMGHLLPGHGGMLDRLDSLIPSAPVAFLLLTVFVGG
jgi:phosphatidate cytidylyltransferase